jgi:hypothetical protein
LPDLHYRFRYDEPFHSVAESGALQEGGDFKVLSMADNFAQTTTRTRHGGGRSQPSLFSSLITEISDLRKMLKVKLDASEYNREWLVDP